MQQSKFGSNPVSNKNLAIRLTQEDKLRMENGIYVVSDLYSVTHPFEKDVAIVSVEAIPEFMPHLIQWSEVAVGRTALFNDSHVTALLGRYLINMTDDELLVVRSQVVHVHQVYGISGIECYPDSFVVHTNIGGKAQSMVVCVFNMMDSVATLRELGERTSIN